MGDTSRRAHYIRARQLEEFIGQAPTTNVATLLVWLVFFAGLKDDMAPEPLILSGLLMVSSCTARLLIWHSHRKAPGRQNSEAWLQRYTIATTGVGLAWSCLYFSLMNFQELSVVAPVLMLFFGIAATAAIALSVYLPAFMLHVYPQAATLIVIVVSQGDGLLFLIVPLLVYAALITIYARQFGARNKRQLIVSADNAGLVEELGQEVKEREAIIQQRTQALRSSNENLGRQIAQREAAENAVQEQYNLLSSVLNSSKDLIYYKDYRNREGVYLGCNQAFADFLGKEIDEIVGQDDIALFGEVDGGMRRITDLETLKEGHGNHESWMSYPDGRQVLFNVRKTPFPDASGSVVGVLAIARDITEQKKSEQTLRRQQDALQHLAHHDQLTGLPNRLKLIETVGNAIDDAAAQGRQLAVLFIDLDHFKVINDSLGHTVGDQLLVAISQRLKNSVRSADMVARLGGDEFTVVLRDLSDEQGALEVADKILEAFGEPVIIDSHTLKITGSVGISLYPRDGCDTESLLRNADAAMYRSKRDGRNAARLYTADMTEHAVARVALESELHKALQNGEFTLRYQPQVDMRTGEIVGVEALLRWNHPRHGLMGPDLFIDVAEDTGLIVTIGAWVLEQACLQREIWRRAGISHLLVAVNISARQMLDSRFAEIVKEKVVAAGADPREIELEITEGLLIQHPESARRTLQSFRDMGIQVAVDHFGTGYSSLAYLKHYPISKLKIDASFVREIERDRNDEAIASAVIALGRSLDLDVIAEGVETSEQADILMRHGCFLAQGYFYSHPLDAPDFQEFALRRMTADPSTQDG